MHKQTSMHKQLTANLMILQNLTEDQKVLVRVQLQRRHALYGVTVAQEPKRCLIFCMKYCITSFASYPCIGQELPSERWHDIFCLTCG